MEHASGAGGNSCDIRQTNHDRSVSRRRSLRIFCYVLQSNTVMRIALVGTPLPAAVRKRLGAAGLQVVTPERAALRLVASPTPPPRPPRRPWLWCPPHEP